MHTYVDSLLISYLYSFLATLGSLSQIVPLTCQIYIDDEQYFASLSSFKNDTNSRGLLKSRYIITLVIRSHLVFQCSSPSHFHVVMSTTRMSHYFANGSSNLTVLDIQGLHTVFSGVFIPPLAQRAARQELGERGKPTCSAILHGYAHPRRFRLVADMASEFPIK